MPTLRSLAHRTAAVAVAAAFSAALFMSAAEARMGGGKSFGSRGDRTYAAPPPTKTAPGTAQPIQRSMTPQPAPGAQATTGAAAGTAAAAQTRPAMGMVGSLLMGGLIGAGLATFLGAGALANVLGFLLQALLIGGIVWLVLSFFRNRAGNGARPVPVTVSTGRPAGPARAQTIVERSGIASGGAAVAQAVSGPVTIGTADYDAFEQALYRIQEAYGRGDLTRVETALTPEMLSYLAHELADNRANGVVNEVSQPKLLQGDLAEAWRESGAEYATVAMRYAIIDATIKEGRVIEGSRTEPQQVVEIWTFRRPVGGTADQWELSAIQQAA